MSLPRSLPPPGRKRQRKTDPLPREPKPKRAKVSVSGEPIVARAIDWEAVRRDYEYGLMSVAALAGKWGVTKSTVATHRERESWTRYVDEVAAIAARKTQSEPVSDEQALAVAASRQAEVITRHQRMLDKLATTALQMQEMLAQQLDRPNLARTDTIEALVGRVSGIVDGLMSLANVAHKLIPLERLSHGIADPKVVDAAPVQVTMRIETGFTPARVIDVDVTQ